MVAIAETLATFHVTCAAIARERRVRDYQRDSLLIQEGKIAERERVEAWAGHEQYEPESEAPHD